MINPIKHFNAVYNAKKPLRKIQPQGYTENYFMKKSPLSKDSMVESNLSHNKFNFMSIIKQFFGIK